MTKHLITSILHRFPDESLLISFYSNRLSRDPLRMVEDGVKQRLTQSLNMLPPTATCHTVDNGVMATPVVSRYAGAAAPASLIPSLCPFHPPRRSLLSKPRPSWVWFETVSKVVPSFHCTSTSSSSLRHSLKRRLVSSLFHSGRYTDMYIEFACILFIPSAYNERRGRV